MGHNWTARKRHYVRGAHPADRMFGLDCGCVVIVRNYDWLQQRGVVEMQSEYMMLCSENEADCRVRQQIRQDNPLVDATVAAAYHASIGGNRWQ